MKKLSAPEIEELAPFQVENHEKERGIEKLLAFIERIKEDLHIKNAEDVLRCLENLENEELLKIFERVNGILTDTPIKERNAFTVDKQQQVSNGEEVVLVFPDNKTRHGIFDEYSELVASLLKDKQLSKETISMYLFNLIVYLHPLVDGNGRTARFFANYAQMLDDKNEYEQAKSLQRNLKERGRELSEYHHQMDTLAFKDRKSVV